MLRNYHFTVDWFSAAEPTWHRLLDQHAGAPGLRFLEVGVYEGRATVWLLDHVLTDPTARLDCVDPFVWPSWSGRPRRARMDRVKHRFHANVAASSGAAKVRLIEARSDAALVGLPASSYHCAYVDGSHRAADVLSDAVLCFRLLRPAGLLILDDYGMGDDLDAPDARAPALPRRGIDAFLSAYADRVEVVMVGYQLALRKRPVRRAW
jgi:hypothetical protein